MAILRDVEPYEVDQALHGPQHRWPRHAGGPHGINYVAIFTRTNAGRPIIVVTRQLGGHDSMIIAARGMTPAEIALFEQWEQDHE